ncbi:hypothetical protein, partial [Streptomyces sp. NPDC059515]|uniref:hypothetical protein n=1 Tax=Streptomyces sp. NPDC059515 TaxID=3346854 RepID=UPI0036B985B5
VGVWGSPPPGDQRQRRQDEHVPERTAPPARTGPLSGRHRRWWRRYGATRARHAWHRRRVRLR